MHWFLSAIGGLFCLLAAAMAVLELLVERQKQEDDRNWPDAWDRIRRDAGGLAIGGLLMFPLAIFMVEPVAGFRLFLVPVGTVAAVAPLVHLVASWRAARPNSPHQPAWQNLADRSGRVMTGCCYLMAIGVAVFAIFSMEARYVELSDRVGALESGRATGE